jgi:hypothetical protein
VTRKLQSTKHTHTQNVTAMLCYVKKQKIQTEKKCVIIIKCAEAKEKSMKMNKCLSVFMAKNKFSFFQHSASTKSEFEQEQQK